MTRGKLYVWEYIGASGKIVQQLNNNADLLNQIVQTFGNARIKTEKLKDSSGYSLFAFRFNQKSRVICTVAKHEDKDCLVVLEVLENHEYDRSPFLKGTVEINLDSMQIIASSNKEELSSVASIPIIRGTHINGGAIILSITQSDILDKAGEPSCSVINGLAGSGKTTIAQSLINWHSRNSDTKTLYVTSSSRLVDVVREQTMQEQNDSNHSEIPLTDSSSDSTETSGITHFSSYQDLCKATIVQNILTKDSVREWVSHYSDRSSPKSKKSLKSNQSTVGSVVLSEDIQTLIRGAEIDAIYDNLCNLYSEPTIAIDNKAQWQELLQLYMNDKLVDIYQFVAWVQSYKLDSKTAADKTVNFQKLNHQDKISLYQDICKITFLGKKEEFGKKHSDGKYNQKALSNLTRGYKKFLKTHNKLDLKLTTTDVYANNQEQTQEQNKYNCILVDETQDLSKGQIEYIASRLAKGGSIYFFRDGNQSIHDTFNLTMQYIREIAGSISDDKTQSPAIKEYHLNHSYRTPERVTKLANKLLDVKAQVIGGKLNKHEGISESSETSDSDKLISEVNEKGFIGWVNEDATEDKEALSQLVQDAYNILECVIIIPDEKMRQDAVKNFKDMAIIFTPLQVKGLEYKKIILYKFFSGEYDGSVFVNGEVGENYNANQSTPQNFPKDLTNAKYALGFNKLFTAITRTTNDLIFVEDNKQKGAELYKKIFKESIGQGAQIKLDEVTLDQILSTIESHAKYWELDILLQYAKAALTRMNSAKTTLNSQNKKDYLIKLSTIITQNNNQKTSAALKAEIKELTAEIHAILENVQQEIESEETFIETLKSSSNDGVVSIPIVENVDEDTTLEGKDVVSRSSAGSSNNRKVTPTPVLRAVQNENLFALSDGKILIPENNNDKVEWVKDFWKQKKDDQWKSLSAICKADNSEKAADTLTALTFPNKAQNFSKVLSNQKKGKIVSVKILQHYPVIAWKFIKATAVDNDIKFVDAVYTAILTDAKTDIPNYKLLHTITGDKNKEFLLDILLPKEISDKSLIKACCSIIKINNDHATTPLLSLLSSATSHNIVVKAKWDFSQEYFAKALCSTDNNGVSPLTLILGNKTLITMISKLLVVDFASCKTMLPRTLCSAVEGRSVLYLLSLQTEQTIIASKINILSKIIEEADFTDEGNQVLLAKAISKQPTGSSLSATYGLITSNNSKILNSLVLKADFTSQKQQESLAIALCAVHTKYPVSALSYLASAEIDDTLPFHQNIISTANFTSCKVDLAQALCSTVPVDDIMTLCALANVIEKQTLKRLVEVADFTNITNVLVDSLCRVSTIQPSHSLYAFSTNKLGREILVNLILNTKFSTSEKQLLAKSMCQPFQEGVSGLMFFNHPDENQEAIKFLNILDFSGLEKELAKALCCINKGTGVSVVHSWVDPYNQNIINIINKADFTGSEKELAAALCANNDESSNSYALYTLVTKVELRSLAESLIAKADFNKNECYLQSINMSKKDLIDIGGNLLTFCTKTDSSVILSQNERITLNKQGIELHQKEQYNKAIECYNKLIAEDKQDTKVLFNRGRAYQEVGQTGSAIEDFLSVLVSKDSHAKAHQYLGLCYQRQGDINKAKELLNKALSLDSNLSLATKCLAECKSAVLLEQRDVTRQDGYEESDKVIVASLFSTQLSNSALDQHEVDAPSVEFSGACGFCSEA